MTNKELKKLISVIAIELFLVIAFVWFFDPFYQYHRPLLSYEPSLIDSENQVPGTIRTFEYDSVLLGSSIAENCNTDIIDEERKSHTLKIIKKSARPADLMYYLGMVHENREIHSVYYCLDISSLQWPAETVLFDAEIPRYLHTDTVWDDGTYIFNKDIIFEQIPTILAYSLIRRNVGGNAYNWAADKSFDVSSAMSAYAKGEKVDNFADFVYDKGDIADNIELIVNEVIDHPEIDYYFFIPPASMLWWDCQYVNGLLDEYYYILDECLEALVQCQNAFVYDFQMWEDATMNLDYYMDMIHYAPTVNDKMLKAILNDEDRVTSGNLSECVDATKRLAESIYSDEIYKYYPIQ